MNHENPEGLKYSIKSRLLRLSVREHETVMKQLLAAIAPASRSTLYRWMSTKQGQRFEIPYTLQQKIAAVLQCNIADLSNPMKQ